MVQRLFCGNNHRNRKLHLQCGIQEKIATAEVAAPSLLLERPLPSYSTNFTRDSKDTILLFSTVVPSAIARKWRSELSKKTERLLQDHHEVS